MFNARRYIAIYDKTKHRKLHGMATRSAFCLVAIDCELNIYFFTYFVGTSGEFIFLVVSLQSTIQEHNFFPYPKPLSKEYQKQLIFFLFFKMFHSEFYDSAYINSGAFSEMDCVIRLSGQFYLNLYKRS